MALLSFIKHSARGFDFSKKTRLLPSDRGKILDTLAEKLNHALPRHRLRGLAWMGISLISALAAFRITHENADTEWYRTNRPSAQIWKSSFEALGFMESHHADEAQALSRTLPARSALSNTVWYREDGLVWVVIESTENDSAMLPRVFQYDRALKNAVLMKKYGAGAKGWKIVEGSGWKAFTPALENAGSAAKKWNELIGAYGKAAPKAEARDPRAILY